MSSHVSDSSSPVRLPRNNPALRLLQQVRDESHRFALDFHRSLRKRATLRSELEELPGLGRKRAQELLRRFGSMKGVREADLDDLLAVPGFPEPLARRLYGAFHGEQTGEPFSQVESSLSA